MGTEFAIGALIELSPIVKGIVLLSRKKKLKALLKIKDIRYTQNGQALMLKIILTNKGREPLCIEEIYLKKDNENMNAKQIASFEMIVEANDLSKLLRINTPPYSNTINIEAKDDIDFTYEIFDINSDIEAGHSEKGWILFTIQDKNHTFSNFGIKLSTGEEDLVEIK